MILGIGTDIVDVARIDQAIIKHGGRFEEKHFTPEERAVCDARKDRVRCYAARFAAKEAFFKAVSGGPGNWPAWQSVWLEALPNGAPRLRYNRNELAEPLRSTLGAVHVSVSHSSASAVATVILESVVGT